MSLLYHVNMYLEFLILACIIYILASKTALLAKGFREAGQTAANAFRTFADKPEVDYSRKEQKHPITKAVLAPMKAVRKLFVSMELHLDASIDKLDNLAMNSFEGVGENLRPFLSPEMRHIRNGSCYNYDST